VINSITNLLVDEIPLNTVAPSGIIYNAENNYIYVTSAGSDSVSVINGTTNAVISNIPVGLGPNGIAYDQSSGNVFISNSKNGTISVIDGLTNIVTDTIALESSSTPNGILYNQDIDSIFVTDSNTSTVHVIKNP
jgi:YVTN family beta-propeller protein